MKKYKLTDEEFAVILAINRKGGDPVMFLSGGRPIGRSLQEKINDFWQDLGLKYGFNWETIKPINNREFYAQKKELSK